MRSVRFVVKGKEYTLRYTFNSICEIEEMAGVGLPKLVSDEKVGLNAVRLVVWGGLKWCNPGITKGAVGDLLKNYIEEKGDYQELFRQAVHLMNESMGGKPVDETTEGETDEGKERTE